ncbi:Ditrans,polycis-undecaprenyl-diphosphate synthase ((2E,6E)-farnesyl-diphosphate specific), partial [Haemophilus influenzae]
MYLVLVKLYK